jgi:hypothetical protein
MADNSGMALIRGIDIDKVAKGFAEEVMLMKRFCLNTNTSAREIRWYQKTAGFIDSTDTSGITASQIANVAQGALPVVAEQSWTRQTSYVRKYMIESPLISDEDIKDSDIDILAGNVKDLVRAVERQVDLRIWNVVTENLSVTNINTVAITHEWDDYTNTTPIADLMQAKAHLQTYNYNPEGAVLMLNPNEHMYLMNWLIATKGSSIPTFASQRVGDGVVMEILGLRVVVSNVVTADYAVIFIPQTSVTWKTFMPVSSVLIEEKLIGTKIRVAEEGEALLTDPRSVCLLSNVGPS